VRDNISHSFDIDSQVVTCEASMSDNIRRYLFRQITFTRSYLTAFTNSHRFLLSKLILDDADTSLMTLHGLNAIYLESLDSGFGLMPGK
jgi:hypothetical protein